MMKRYDLMIYSGVMGEWKHRTMRNTHYQFERGVLRQDKSWQVLLLFALVAGTFAVMFVRWWLCI